MAGLLGDVLNFVSGGGYGKSQDVQQNIVDETRNIPLPILKEYYPELYTVVSELIPENETVIDLGPSKMEGIATDPALRTAQMNALNKLMGIGEAGGRDAQFLADQARLEQDVNTNLQGQQGAIQQNMATRGMSGGMSEMVNKQLAAQAAANRQAQIGMDMKAQAERRALDSLIQGGQLGGQMQAQDFGQKSQVAQAQDMINKFNAANRQQVMSNNVNTRNQAQQYNIGARQNVANQNVGQKNAASQYNLNLPQQNYENELRKRGLLTGAAQGLAGAYQGEADRNTNFLGQIIQAGSKAATKGGG